MPKQKTVYCCTECGHEHGRWMGQCGACGAWNTLEERTVETVVAPKPAKRDVAAAPSVERAPRLRDIPQSSEERFATGIGEFDRVLGGGVVPGSLLILGGDPGIGKSTLLMQVSRNIAQGGRRVLYVSGEESARQLRLRATRLGVFAEDIHICCDTELSMIIAQIDLIAPEFVVVDSIQTLSHDGVASSPGSVSQVRECAQVLLRVAKRTGCAVFLIGHVTKEGSLAGPRVLEHMVDAVLSFHGEWQQGYRILRAVKNRFGSINEIGIFEMAYNGMQEVKNPSEFLIAQHRAQAVGSIITCVMEGMRPVLVDVQALVAPTAFSAPRRQAVGFDSSRLAMLLAVLEKRAGLTLYNLDAYINIAGGLELDEPAADLPLVCAVASSHKGVPPPESFAVMGEVGLTGEVRAIADIDRRVAECARMGFKHVILPRGNGKARAEGMKLYFTDTVSETLRLLYDK